MALKTTLSIGVGLLMLQELFIEHREMSHSVFNFYWPQGRRTEIRVMMAVKKDLLDKIILKHRTDLVTHPYFILLEIWNLDQQSKRLERKTQVFNIYDNQVG